MAPATAALFRADLFRRVGTFDATFESYLEDVDFGLRCALAGFSGAYVPDAVAYHWGSASLGPWNPEVVRLIARNQSYLVAKHYPPALRRLLLVADPGGTATLGFGRPSPRGGRRLLQG